MNVAQPPIKENSQVISSSINSSGSSFWIWGCTFFSLLLLPSLFHAQNHISTTETFFENGITLTAPPRPFKTNPMTELNAVCADWVALIPYGFIRKGTHEVLYNIQNYQWWGETVKGIERSIQLAKEKELKIMLKPQLWMMHNWIGDFEINDEKELASFTKSYTNYIIEFAQLAQKYQVEMFCIATEFKKPLAQHPKLLESLIKKVRKIYDGKIIYAANWDNYDQIPLWDEIDYIGINAYFPLMEESNPKVSDLVEHWTPILEKIEEFSCLHNKGVWLTEYGYLSVDGAAGKTWILEKNINNLNINEQAQSNALEALYLSVPSFESIKGGFLWKWFPEGKGHEGYPEKDYTPQNKLSESTIRDYFCH